PRERTDFWLIALHPSGYAELKCSRTSDRPVLKLTPWARLEGTFRIEGKPRSGANVSLSPVDNNWNATTPRVMWHYHNQATDPDGQFLFDHVVAGKHRISNPLQLFDEEGAAGMQSVGEMVLDLQPGKTTHFDLGTGRRVIGQLQWA